MENQNTNAHRTHSTEQRQSSTDRTRQIRSLVSQSFDIFNIYGKEPEALASIMMGFTIALEDIDMKYINMAFKERLQNFSIMPTPADIRKSAFEFQGMEERVSQRQSAPQIENHYLPPEITRNCVSWYGLDYTGIVENGMLEHVKKYIKTELNKNQRIEYLKYLRHWCNFPNDFMVA